MTNPFIGWEKQCFGQMSDESGAYCAVGWLNRAWLTFRIPGPQLTRFMDLMSEKHNASMAWLNDELRKPPSWFVEQWAELMEGK